MAALTNLFLKADGKVGRGRPRPSRRAAIFLAYLRPAALRQRTEKA